MVLRFLALSIWPSTSGLPRAPQALLRPPRPPRVSDPPRTSLGGGEASGPPPRSETLRRGDSGVCQRRGFKATEKGRRRQSGRRRLLRTPRGHSRPNPELTPCAWSPKVPALLRFASRLGGVVLGETCPLFPTLASGIGGKAFKAPAAGPGEDRAGDPLGAALRLPLSQPVRGWSVRTGACGPR